MKTRLGVAAFVLAVFAFGAAIYVALKEASTENKLPNIEATGSPCRTALREEASEADLDPSTPIGQLPNSVFRAVAESPKEYRPCHDQIAAIFPIECYLLGGKAQFCALVRDVRKRTRLKGGDASQSPSSGSQPPGGAKPPSDEAHGTQPSGTSPPSEPAAPNHPGHSDPSGSANGHSKHDPPGQVK